MGQRNLSISNIWNSLKMNIDNGLGSLELLEKAQITRLYAKQL